MGSNNWVVAPGLTTTGGALLANDPHLGISMPSIWFLNGLHCAPVTDACPYDVAGASFPGVPAIALGHNARIAWGATNAGTDAQDLFIEQTDPADPTRYLFDGGIRPFETRTEEILVKGASEPVRQEVRLTAHGPILNDVEKRLADAPLMSLNWTAIAQTDRTFEAILGLNTADSFEEFRESLSLYGTPSQNFIYADVDGHIGYQSARHVPDPWRRPDQPAATPRRRRHARMDGQHPVRRAPVAARPPGGNDRDGQQCDRGCLVPVLPRRPLGPGLPGGASRRRPARAQRGRPYARRHDRAPDGHGHGPGANAAIWLMAAEPATDDGRIVLERILAWDGACDIDSLGCAAWSMFEYRLHRDVFDDDLGPLARDYVGTPPAQMLIDALFDDPEATWWDDVSTPNRETSAEIVARALDEAGSALATAYGASTNWTWGRVHTATFQEATIGSSGIAPLEWYFNDGPHAVAGAYGALDNTYYRFSRPTLTRSTPTTTLSALTGCST